MLAGTRSMNLPYSAFLQNLLLDLTTVISWCGTVFTLHSLFIKQMLCKAGHSGGQNGESFPFRRGCFVLFSPHKIKLWVTGPLILKARLSYFFVFSIQAEPFYSKVGKNGHLYMYVFEKTQMQTDFMVLWASLDSF